MSLLFFAAIGAVIIKQFCWRFLCWKHATSPLLPLPSLLRGIFLLSYRFLLSLEDLLHRRFVPRAFRSILTAQFSPFVCHSFSTSLLGFNLIFIQGCRNFLLLIRVCCLKLVVNFYLLPHLIDLFYDLIVWHVFYV